MWEWISYPPLGILVGIIAGLLGIGGGVVIVPILVFVFTANDFPPQHIMQIALATSLGSIVFTSVSSFMTHHRHGAVRWDVVKGISLGILIGTFSGTWLAAQAMTTLGADYTFNWGRGLYVLTEYMQLSSGRQVWPSDDHLSLSAVSLRYPVGLLDMVQLLHYYDWNNAEHYRLLNWSRTYDRWQLILMAYWNPRQFLLYQHLQDVTAFSGKGLQGMIVFNF